MPFLDEINRMSAGKPARTGGEDEDIWRQGAALMNEAKNDPNIKYSAFHPMACLVMDTKCI